MTTLAKFLRDDAGAVTIDWVAISAGVLVVGIMTVYAIYNNGVSDLVVNVNSNALAMSTSTDAIPGGVVNMNQ